MEGWTSEQRGSFLDFIVDHTSREEQCRLRDTVDALVPQETDPLRLFPRPVCIMIFRYLDPRSLSRCAQVGHAWKSLASIDAFWKVKCLRRGWHLYGFCFYF